MSLTLESVLKQIDTRIDEYKRARALLSYEGEPTHTLKLVSAHREVKPKRKISKKGREAIAEGQRLRWLRHKRAQRKDTKTQKHMNKVDDLAASGKIRYGRD